MAIFIEVVAANGRPPESPQRVEIAEAGGSIGRAEDNVLKLPDPQRHISRYHARVTHRLSRYFILDTGSSTPVILNSVPIGNGREAEIRPGDELRIGHYLLHVTAPADAGSTQVARDALSTGNLQFSATPTSPSPVAVQYDASPPTVMVVPAMSPSTSAVGSAGAASARRVTAASKSSGALTGANSPAAEPNLSIEAPQEAAARVAKRAQSGDSAAHLPTEPIPTAGEGSIPAALPAAPGGAGPGWLDPSPIPGLLDPRVIVAAMKGEIATGLKHARPPGIGSGGESSAGGIDIDVGATTTSAPVGQKNDDQAANSVPQQDAAGMGQASRFQRFKPPPTFILDEAGEGSFVDIGAASDALPQLASDQIDRTGSSILRALYDGAGINYPAAMQDFTEEQAFALGGLMRVVAIGLREVLSSEAVPANTNPIAAAASVEAAICYLVGVERATQPDPRIAVREAFECIAAAQRALPAAMRSALRIVMTDLRKALQAELARSLSQAGETQRLPKSGSSE